MPSSNSFRSPASPRGGVANNLGYNYDLSEGSEYNTLPKEQPGQTQQPAQPQKPNASWDVLDDAALSAQLDELESLFKF